MQINPSISTKHEGLPSITQSLAKSKCVSIQSTRPRLCHVHLIALAQWFSKWGPQGGGLFSILFLLLEVEMKEYI